MASQVPPPASHTVYGVHNYTFGTKPPKFEKDSHVGQRMERLKERYQQEGLRRSVDAVIVVHEHGHPHVLLIQIGTSFFKLPGGRLRPGEDEVEGLLRKMTTSLAPEAESLRPDWRVSEFLGTYFRPNFENMMYPYCPPHVERPKEVRRLFAVQLPERCYFAVPKNMRLIAVPLFEIYDNVTRYGPVISAIPQLLSRFDLQLVGGKGGAGVPPPMPAAGAPQQPSGAVALSFGGAPQPAAAQQQQQQQQQPPPHQAAPPPQLPPHQPENMFVDFDE